MSSPEQLQLVQLFQSTGSRRWFNIKGRWCHIISWVLVWRGHCLFVFFLLPMSESLGVKRNTHTSYFCYHLTMKERGGGKLFTIHHDLTSVDAFMFVWGLADVLSGGCLLSAPTSDDPWRELDTPQLLLRTHQEPAEDPQTQWWLKMTPLNTSCVCTESFFWAGKQQMMQTVRDIPVIIRQNNTSDRNVLRIKGTSEVSVILTY